MTRGKLFFASRPFIRLVVGRWSVQAPPPEGPTVFVCSHGDMAGPLATQCWLPFPTRPWVLHVFLSREECRRQYRDYTFTQRFGLPRPAAALLAWAVSGYASALVRSVGAIPVYRGSARLKETFRRTVEALQAAGCTGDMSAEEICEAIVAVMPTITVDGLTGQGMTWAESGEVSKAPMAVVIKDGVYVTP